MRSILSALVVPLLAVACTAPQRTEVPVYPDSLPTAAPKLTVPEGGQVSEATDGFLYGISVQANVGDALVVRYGGEWPKSAGDRPLLGLVRVTRAFPDKSALLSPEYTLAGVSLTGGTLEPWSGAKPPVIGKGLGLVSGVSSEEVALEIGAENGVSAGDQYVIVRTPRSNERLGARVVAASQVTQTTKSAATAEIVARAGKVKKGDWAIFVGPGRVTKAGVTIQVAAFQGAADDRAQNAVANAIGALAKAEGVPEVKVETIAQRFDPLDPYFSGPTTDLDPTSGHRMIVTGSIVDGRLVLNYANTGLSVAHAMIAATPEQGIAAGNPDNVSQKSVRGLWVNLRGAMETHRGRNAVAICALERDLRQPGWGGRARWHARDQLAMRWVQAGDIRQALWTVKEDVALAEADSDDDAIVNSVGTLMPLYEELGLKDESLLAAERFYMVRKSIGESPYTMHAWKAYIDALYHADKSEEAAAELDKFEEACAPVVEELQALLNEDKTPNWSAASCAADLFFAYMGNVWRSEGDARSRWLARAEEVASLLSRPQVAGLRVAQGLAALYEDDHDGAHIAFLEAQRLYRAEKSAPGVARVQSLRFNLYLAQERRQEAFESAMAAAEAYSDMGDVHELISVYRSLPWLYANVPQDQRRLGPYINRARPTMREALKYQLASGNPQRVAEVFLATGRFVMLSAPGDAEALLKRAREFALQGTEFGIAARSTFLLAILARGRGDGAGLRRLLDEAKEMAGIAGDAGLLQQIIDVERGGSQPDRPTL